MWSTYCHGYVATSQVNAGGTVAILKQMTRLRESFCNIDVVGSIIVHTQAVEKGLVK